MHIYPKSAKIAFHGACFHILLLRYRKLKYGQDRREDYYKTNWYANEEVERLREERVRVGEEIMRDRDIEKQETWTRIKEGIYNRSLKWFGHILRMEENRWPKRLFARKPTGKNKKGRPRRSWNYGIRKARKDRDLEEDVAYNRKAWRLGVGRQPAVV
ncbi:hypothetical protein RN001_014315 [Aquatica leii]|uniref:Uncharacterized protein n=1 Tax=Aquatica leii TaxID=1421715 RepID=A0AAN7Q0N3_9COLE|nr:hypothetical protein RN001_014315 [Aquatica leii]